MSAFKVRPLRAAGPGNPVRLICSRYPRLHELPSTTFTAGPFRSSASRALAAALTTILAGAASAQPTLGLLASNNNSHWVRGRVAADPQPVIADLIDSTAATAMITRLLREAGYSADDSAPLSKHSTQILVWDAERRAGIELVRPENLSTRPARIQFLNQTMGPQVRLANDPRGDDARSVFPLTVKEGIEVAAAMQSRTATTLRLQPVDLLAQTNVPGSVIDPAESLRNRAEALHRLEAQVREFITYLQSQGR